MPHFSDVRARPLLDASGERLGRLEDLAAQAGERVPAVRWAMIGTPDGERVVPWADIAIEPAHARLRRRLSSIAPVPLPDGAVRLGDLLDRRGIDTSSGRPAVVNDIELEEAAGELRILAAEVGWRGLLRRIGVEGLALALTAGRLPRRLVPWHQLDLEAEHHPRDGEVDDQAGPVHERGDEGSGHDGRIEPQPVQH